MSIEDDVFLRYTPDFDKLIKYGFKSGKDFSIELPFMNDEFKALITVSVKGSVSGKVYDIEDNNEYLPLRIKDNEGAFAGEVKNAYINLLTDIRENCFTENYFISAQGNRISKLIKEKYNDNPLFLWENDTTSGVFKNLDNNKWYGIIMYINFNKLNEPSDEPVQVMNLKIDKDKIPELIKKNGIYPAYHMNKKYWITVLLNDTLCDEDIMEYIEESHSYTVSGKNKK